MNAKCCWFLCLLAAQWLTVPGLSVAAVVLKADDHDGKDNVWKARYAAGKNSWGINGTGNPLNGSMWWNSFPGQTGKYKVELGAVTEPDGNSRYRFFIDDSKVHEGRYPYSTGSLNCSSSTFKAVYLDIGEHQVQQGAAIRLWGESVYPCGSSHGQYTGYWEIKFTLQEPQGNLSQVIGKRMPWSECARAVGMNPDDHKAYRRLVERVAQEAGEHWREVFGRTPRFAEATS